MERNVRESIRLALLSIWPGLSEFWRRPLVVMATFQILGLLAWRWSILLFLPLAGLVLPLKARYWGLGGLLLAFMLHAPVPEAVVLQKQRVSQFRGTIMTAGTPSGDRDRYLVRGGDAILLLYANPVWGLGMGDDIRVRGELRPLSEASEGFWVDQGVIGEVRPAGRPTVERRGLHLFHLAGSVRHSFLGLLQDALGAERAAIVDAVAFNNQAELEDPLMDNLRRTGTIHIISTSGLHIALVTMALLWCFSWFPIPRWSQAVFVMAILLLYVAATGFHPPGIRSWIMASCLLMAPFVIREHDALSSLALASIIVLAWFPASVASIGYQLSFLVVLALILFLKAGEVDWKAGLRSSLVAQGAASPLIAHVFGMFSILAPVANMITAPLVTWVLAGSLIGWILGLVWHAAGVLFIKGFVLSPSVLLAAIVNGLGALPVSAVYFRPLPLIAMVALYTAVLTYWRPVARPVD